MKRIALQACLLLAVLLVSGCGLNPPARPSPTPTPPAASPTPGPTAAATPKPSPTPVPTLAHAPLPTPNLAALPRLADLPLGWNQIDPGGATACARGGKYSFWVRKTTSARLMVYFEGGGSCYDGKTCRVGGGYFDDSIDPAFDADNPALKSHGLFALTDPRNPFREDNIVFINYCTGDAYLGNRTVRYLDGAFPYQIQHVGFVNTQAVFHWIFQNYPQPAAISMVGCSAGVAGAFFNFPYFKDFYPRTAIALVGDSGGGFVDGPDLFARQFGAPELLPAWLPQAQNLFSGGQMRGKYLFLTPAQTYPDTRIGLIDSENDGVQAEIIARFDPRLSLKTVLLANKTALQAAAPNLQAFIGPGDYHCITMMDTYYDYTADGVQLNDWLTRLVKPGP